VLAWPLTLLVVPVDLIDESSFLHAHLSTLIGDEPALIDESPLFFAHLSTLIGDEPALGMVACRVALAPYLRSGGLEMPAT
jgi:hypothetical protein